MHSFILPGQCVDNNEIEAILGRNVSVKPPDFLPSPVATLMACSHHTGRLTVGELMVA